MFSTFLPTALKALVILPCRLLRTGTETQALLRRLRRTLRAGTKPVACLSCAQDDTARAAALMAVAQCLQNAEAMIVVLLVWPSYGHTA